jgi:hypothetical protein
MTRFFTTACLRTFCIALQTVALGMAAAEAATMQASQMTAMLWSQPAAAGTAARRFIEPAEARALWDDPQIKVLRTEMENAWDFTAPNGVPGFGPLSPEDVHEISRSESGTRR